MSKITTSVKERIKNYRVEYYSEDRYGDIGGIQIGMYLSTDKAAESVLRRFNRLYEQRKGELSELGVKPLAFIPTIKESIIKVNNSFTKLDIVFGKENIGYYHKNIDIYEKVARFVISIIEDNDMVTIIDK